MMCGIFFSCCQEDYQHPSNDLLEDLRRRGPDGVDSVSTTVTLEAAVSRKSCSNMQKRTRFLTFFSTVLSLRGSSIVKQPLSDSETGSLLCWNGEAWSIGSESIRANDAEYVFNIFLNAANRHSDNVPHTIASQDQSLQGVIDILSSITGPYAFVFYDAPHHRVFYGRDALGRRSLLTKGHSIRGLVLSSICDPTDFEGWMEVEADGIYVLDLTANIDLSEDVNPVTHIPWVFDYPKSTVIPTLVPHIFRLHILICKY